MSYSDGDGRLAMPAEIKRRVLVEAGHRCAIPTCRHIEVDIHHIIPWATCQEHDYDNLIALCPNDHRRADRGEIDRKALRLYKFNLRFAHDKFSQLEMDMLFELSKAPAGQGLQWPAFNMMLVKRLLEAQLIRENQPQGGGVFIMGMQTAPSVLTLEPKGRRFLDELGLVEL